MALWQFLICAVTWFPTRQKTTPFQFRWSFLLVAALLIIADRCYFLAVSDKDALISVITVFRRSSVFISFVAGIVIFKERKSKLKFLALLGIVAGLCLISLGKG
jgi:transporter family protein